MSYLEARCYGCVFVFLFLVLPNPGIYERTRQQKRYLYRIFKLLTDLEIFSFYIIYINICV